MAPKIQEGECKEYIEIESKGSCGSTEASNQATDGQNSQGSVLKKRGVPGYFEQEEEIGAHAIELD